MNYYTGLFFVLAAAIIWTKQDLPIPLLGAEIKLMVHGPDSSEVLLYNMHDNENTSALAGRITSTRYGGQYYELIHTGDRNIGIPYGEDSIWIDPNRIYTDTGVWQQLQKNNVQDTLLFQSIVDWRDSLLILLRIHDRSLVIALHNNTNKFYSLTSYTEGGEYEAEADTTFQGRIHDMDDFYFVTNPAIFDILSGGRYHVILQNNATMTDDGSLSVYCGRLGIPYINVEAQHHHLIRQIKMLIFAFEQVLPNLESERVRE